MRFLSLVWLFWQQLVRRKSLWVVMAIAGGAILVNYTVERRMAEMLQEGVRYDLATRRAGQELERYAQQVRFGAVALAFIVGALVAPPSRRDGTTQFVLTLSVSPLPLTNTQYA